MYSDKSKKNARIEYLYKTKYLPTYLAFILVYPFYLEDLEGEIWADIKDYEGWYQISNYGRIKSFARGVGKILKPSLARNGYLYVTLKKTGSKKHFGIHQLVAENFIPNPENKPQVNHINGNKFDNCCENLEWMTSVENHKHAKETGLKNYKCGIECYNATFTEEDIRYIRKVYKPYDTEYGMTALAKKFNVSPSCIDRIVHGKTYKNID